MSNLSEINSNNMITVLFKITELHFAVAFGADSLAFKTGREISFGHWQSCRSGALYGRRFPNGTGDLRSRL